MMPKARPRRARRKLAWLPGRKGNRRVKLGAGGLPSPSRLVGGLGARLKRSARLALIIGLTIAGAGLGLAAHRFLTRSSHFAVRALRFSPTQHVSAESLAARGGTVVGANLFKIDLDELQRDVSQEPWVQSAHARRELPSTVMVEIVEREPACVVALGPLYLADAKGAVFKRATPEEAASLPVVTGIDRDLYLADPDGAKAVVREALAALEGWRARPRPAVGEAHVDRLLGVTLYTVADGLGVRLGRVDDESEAQPSPSPWSDRSLAARLRRFDAVSAALESSGEHPRLIYLDNRARPDRVTVKLATTPEKTKSERKSEIAPASGDDSET